MKTYPPKLRRSDASAYLLEVHGLQFKPSTLAKMFSVRSDGPPAFKVGHIPYYATADLDAWAKSISGSAVRSTSEHAARAAA